MTFKEDWEKTQDSYAIDPGVIKKMVAIAYPERSLISNELVNGGCANLNFKIQLDTDLSPLILRIYLRDKYIAKQEQSLSHLLQPIIPIPKVYKICDYGNYRFAIHEFISGITLRELLLSNEAYDVERIMYEVGIMLSKISKHEFSASGFFDENLNITHNISSEYYVKYAKNTLQNAIAFEQLSTQLILNINTIFDKYAQIFPDENDRQLVHADFDPANILVSKINDDWSIVGILDWEFAFSGSTLCDIANMLRYADQMPKKYEHGFLQGLKDGGINLPNNWKVRIDLLNLFSLVDCLARSNPITSPNKCKDICRLINRLTYILSNN